MPKNSKGGKRKVEEEEAEEEEEEGDENYERSVAAFESYEKFCDDGKLSHLKDAIGKIFLVSYSKYINSLRKYRLSFECDLQRLFSQCFRLQLRRRRKRLTLIIRI